MLCDYTLELRGNKVDGNEAVVEVGSQGGGGSNKSMFFRCYSGITRGVVP